MMRRRLSELVRERVERNGHAKPAADPWPAERRGDADERDYPSDAPTEAPSDQDEPPGILLSKVQAQRVEWLWPARIPLGKLTILDGDPGLGKSVLTLELAA